MIIDGKKIAQGILQRVKEDVAQLRFRPVFCDILVGDNPVSAQYVRMKARQAEHVGMQFQQANFSAAITEPDLLTEIQRLNRMPHMSGLIVQLPLPQKFNKQIILDAIDPRIDVDCTSTTSSELFYQGKSVLQFPTAAAVMEILNSLPVDLSKKNTLVVGQGMLVGKPVAFLLKQRGYGVEIADKNSGNTEELLKAADVIISATGKQGLITGKKIKPGCTVIDAGTSESKGGVVGDADFESVSRIAAYLSPVPGGVGPVTVAMLLKNVLTVAKSL